MKNNSVRKMIAITIVFSMFFTNIVAGNNDDHGVKARLLKKPI